MEKLIELLNEYSELRLERLTEEEGQPIRKRHDYELEYPIEKIRVISKQYGFIERLVEKSKIDTQNLITYMKGTSLTFNKVPSTDGVDIDKMWNKFYTETLLMLLSISDTPIEDLILYLK